MKDKLNYTNYCAINLNRNQCSEDNCTMYPICLIKDALRLDENKKGCGKLFNHKVWGERVCGQFEDLKHSDHYIYCEECSKKNKIALKYKSNLYKKGKEALSRLRMRN